MLKQIKKLLRKSNKSRLTHKQESIVEKPFFTKDIFAASDFNIGDYTYGNPTILFADSGANLSIGKFCSIAQNVTIFLGGNHRPDWITTYPFNDLEKYFPESSKIKGHPATKGDVVIGNDVWIGRDVTILSGVSIGDGAIIGARSTITKNVGSYEIWAGNPAKFIKKRFNENDISNLKSLRWWDWDIEKIKKNTKILCSIDISKLNL